MNIKRCSDPAFQAYGKVITGYDTKELMTRMQDTPCPEEVVYCPAVPELEELAIKQELEQRFFGEMPIQLGYCNGKHDKVNALEYHRTSELNLAVSDMLLLLGKVQDISAQMQYDPRALEAFLIERGTLVELYATTLHYAPCHVEDDGFRCVVVLPAGTNMEVTCHDMKSEEDRMLFAKNKWLFAHPAAALEHAYIGLSEEISIERT